MTTSAKKVAKKTAAKRAVRKSSSTFSAAERAAMKDRVKEHKAERNREEGEKDLLAKISDMPPADRTLATKLHTLVTKVAPELVPRTWYGMPAYNNVDGNVLCFFQSAAKFGARYATLGFSDKAALDSGSMWPTYFALTKWTTTTERNIRALLKQAIS